MENGLDEISREIKSIPFIREFILVGIIQKGLEKMLEEEVDISLACTIEIPKKISDSTTGRSCKFHISLEKIQPNRFLKTSTWEI